MLNTQVHCLEKKLDLSSPKNLVNMRLYMQEVHLLLSGVHLGITILHPTLTKLAQIKHIMITFVFIYELPLPSVQ